MVAALLAREHLEGLARRADGVEALLSGGERDLSVTLAVHEQERTADLLHHALEPEPLELLQRLVLCLDAEDPQEMVPRYRERRTLAARDPVQTLLPDGVVVPLGTPRDAGGQPWLERRGPRRVVATEADGHHADAGGIDLRPRGEVVVGGCGVALGLVMQGQVAEADRLAVPGPVHDEAADAAGDEIGHALEVLDLLGHVEAVEEDQRGRAAADPFGMDEERG